MTAQPLLIVEDLAKHFPVKSKSITRRNLGMVKAVDGISFSIKEGETLGLVGESGCGKSTTGRLILRLLPPTAGRVFFNGQDVFSLSKKEMLSLRAEMQIIFQDPYSSLNPRRTVGQIVGEALKKHHHLRGKALEERIFQLLEAVGLSSEHIRRYPHEFSGGQRQRIGIARALAVEPKLIICDEPVSALDVSVQAQVLNLLQDLKDTFNLTYLFIAHDLAVVKHISDRVAVMYVGKLVELADKDDLYSQPLHPYTETLMQAVPEPNPHLRKELKMLEGELPSPLKLPPGCRFHPRCPKAMDVCKVQEPQFREVGGNHWVACHLYSN